MGHESLATASNYVRSERSRKHRAASGGVPEILRQGVARGNTGDTSLWADPRSS